MPTRGQGPEPGKACIWKGPGRGPTRRKGRPNDSLSVLLVSNRTLFSEDGDMQCEGRCGHGCGEIREARTEEEKRQRPPTRLSVAGSEELAKTRRKKKKTQREARSRTHARTHRSRERKKETTLSRATSGGGSLSRGSRAWDVRQATSSVALPDGQLLRTEIWRAKRSPSRPRRALRRLDNTDLCAASEPGFTDEP